MEYKNHNLTFVKNINQELKTADMMLFGEIGSVKREGMLNGDDFAREMVFLTEIGFKTIRLHVNSLGGGIVKGMSIINAMNIVRLNGSSIETHVVGIADSMAGMISAFGDIGKRTIANFGSGTVHEPLAKAKDGKLIPIDEMDNEELKNEAVMMRESLVNLMVSSTRNDISEVRRVMKEGKRLTANEMKSFGMVDKVIKLSNDKIELLNKTAIELMVACSNIKKIESKSKKMKLVNNLLNLSDDAAENSAVEAIQTLQNTVNDNKKSMTDKDLEIKTLKDEKQVLVDKAQEIADANAEAYVDSLINSGKLKKESRESLVNQAKENFEGFKAITDSLEVTFVDVTEQINNDGPDAIEKDEKLAKEYHQHSIAGTLANLEKKSPAKFSKMEYAYMNSETNFDA